MKYPSQKHEGLSSIPTARVERPGKVAYARNPRSGKVEAGSLVFPSQLA